jgi:CubicO group peptidase (beta-lactamase class C family)
VEVTDSTKYDMASLTKVMATTFNIMNLMSSSSIKLDDLVSKYVSNYDTNKKSTTTIANLILHNSGLPFDYSFPIPRTTDEVIEYITFAKPDFPVGTKFQYSNLGYLLLGEIVAKVSKKSFDKYFEQNKVFAGLKNTNFNPNQSEWFNIAPT